MNPETRILNYLKSKGISQAFLCNRINMNPSKLNLSLNGKRKLSRTEYEAICWALGVKADTFIEPKPPARTVGV